LGAQTSNLTEKQALIKMGDGFNIFCRQWAPPQQAERIVVFLHGIEVHSGAFSFMGPELAHQGSLVYAFDRRGSGNSKELDLPRGDIKNFERHLADIDEVVEDARRNYQNKKLFVFGHSIGSAYALWYVEHYQGKIDGLILASSPLKAGFELPVGDTFKVLLSPAYHPHSRLDLVDEWPQAFKESEEYKLISEDALCTKEFGLDFLYNIQAKLANKMAHNASKIEKPTLLIHGEQDVIALPESSKILLEKIASNDKELHMFEGEGANHWYYQSIIPKMSSKYSLEKKRTVSTYLNDWLKKH